MTLSIYLTFDGNCREAFDFYRSVFGGHYDGISTFEEAPGELPVAEEEKGRIMHVALPIGDSVLMGSDSSSMGPPVSMGNNFSISMDAYSRERADELQARLAEGGAVTMPMEDQFWGAYFGMCTDRFGVNWMLVHTPPAE